MLKVMELEDWEDKLLKAVAFSRPAISCLLGGKFGREEKGLVGTFGISADEQSLAWTRLKGERQVIRPNNVMVEMRGDVDQPVLHLLSKWRRKSIVGNDKSCVP